MKSDFMEVLEFAASRHKVHVITNGTMLNESLVERLMALRMKSFFGSGLFYVGVSIEGNEELHDAITTIPGSHRKTTQGLERVLGRRAELGARYPLVHLTCVINRENVRDLVPLYDYGARLGVNVCNLVMNNPATYWHGKNYNQADRLRTPPPPVEEIDPDILREELERLVEKSHTCKTRLRFSPNGITPEEIVRYYSNKSSYQDYRCFSAWAKVGVSAYGDVFSCPHYRLSNVQDHAGTIPWNGEAYRKFRAFLKQERIFPGCLGCCQSEYVGPDNRCRESSGSRIIDRWKGKLYESAASSAFGRE